MKRFVLRSLAGLERVVTAEVLLRLDRVAEQVGPRELVLSARDDEAASVAHGLVGLSTVDDAFLEVASMGPVGRKMADLEEIADLASGLRGDASAELVLGWRGASTDASVLDVTASVLGRQRYSRFDVEDVVGATLSPMLGAVYRSRHEGPSTTTPALSYRVTVDKRRTALLLRLAAQPLHRRPYWRESRQGALHPPLAAAMAMLAELGTADVVLDPFCGSGTIAIEAALLMQDSGLVVASDIDPGAACVTRRNAVEGAQVRVPTVCCDIGALPFRPASIDRVIANPPWDHQVSWSRSPRSAGSLSDVLGEGFRVVLLELEGRAAKALGASWHQLASLPVSLRGQRPVVTVYGSAPAQAVVSIGTKRVRLLQPAASGDANPAPTPSREVDRSGA